ncbi:MAG: isopeptide-forming domain-containing fimbrial protein [Clostridiales bacterium]|nr:isopeptide-forming domain-containing fimbrial protein [Clostridiales bacterium]
MMTKGKWKKIASLALAAILTLSLAAPGFASSGTTTGVNDNTLTVTSDTSGHTYELYQILGGDVDTIDENLYLANVIWGDGVKEANLASALTTNTTLKDYFTFADTSDPQASELADGLANIEAEGSASLTNAFAVVVNANLVDTCVDNNPSPAYNSSTEKYEYTFQSLYDGYYLLRDEPESLVDPQDDDDEDTAGYTLYILQIVNGDNEVEAKTDTTTIDKHIVNPHTDDGDPDLEKTEEYTIGDLITYQLDGSYVPDMTNYSSYWYVVQDTLSAGLTFDNMVSVKVGDKTLEKVDGYMTGESAYYTYYYTTEDVSVTDVNENTVTGTKLTIVFNEFYNSYKGTAYDNAEIVIQYNVHLNEDCNIGSVGNDNTVRLIYSNNPNVDCSGEWDESKDGVGYTTNKKTVTYTTQIKIKKVDDDGNALSGAEFSLSSSDAKYYTYTTTSITTYKQDATGDYYNKSGVWDKSQWDDGDIVAYNQDDPTQTDEWRCVQTSSEVNYYVSASDSSSGSTTVTGTTGADGYVIFTGLGAGTYTLEETDAPEGYNLLADVITVEIKYTDPTLQTEQPYVDQDKAIWDYVVSELSGVAASGESDGTVLITVENSPASLLPSTGGMGILIYVAVGLCAMTGAVVVLRARNRREEE